jgi:hypothetical protein
MEAYADQIRIILERLAITGLDRHVMILSKDELAEMKYWNDKLEKGRGYE